MPDNSDSILRDKAFWGGLGTMTGSIASLLPLANHLNAEDAKPADASLLRENRAVQKKLLSSLPKETWTRKGLLAPDIIRSYNKIPKNLSKSINGPAYLPSFYVKHLTKGKSETPIVFAESHSVPETLAHELGHSTQSGLSRALSFPGRYMGRLKPLAAANLGASIGARVLRDKNPESNAARNTAYGTALLGGGLAIPMIANEVGASVRGHRMLKAIGRNPRLSSLYLPNLAYLLHGAAIGAVPTALGISQFLHDRKKNQVPTE